MAAQGQDSLMGPTIHAVKCGKWPDDVKSNPKMLSVKRGISKRYLRGKVFCALWLADTDPF